MTREPEVLTCDIAISGASYAGLTLAVSLARSLGSDLRLVLMDRRAAAAAGSEDPRASALSAGSRRMLDVLGVWEAVAPEAQVVREIQLTDSSLEAGVRPVLLTYDNMLDDGEAASVIVPNDSLGRALERAVEAFPSIRRLWAAEVRNATAHSDWSTDIRLADGRIVRASLVVAADGRASPLREGAGIKCVAWSYGQTGIVTRVRHELPHAARAIQHFLPDGPFAILPMRGNQSCITWSETTANAHRIVGLDDQGFLEEVERRFSGRLGALTLTGRRATWPLEMHLARSYVSDRLVLIGDAAHGVHPIAGQGLNLALRDVAALCECIVDAMRLGFDPGNSDTLKRHEEWRRFDSTVSAATFDALNRLFSSDWALIRSARELGLSLVDRMPELKRVLVAEAAGVTGELPRLLRGEMA